MGDTPVGRTWDRGVFLTQISGTTVITVNDRVASKARRTSALAVVIRGPSLLMPGISISRNGF